MQARDDIGKAHSKCKDPATKPDAETADEVEEMPGGEEQIVPGNVLQTGGYSPRVSHESNLSSHHLHL